MGVIMKRAASQILNANEERHVFSKRAYEMHFDHKKTIPAIGRTLRLTKELVAELIKEHYENVIVGAKTSTLDEALGITEDAVKKAIAKHESGEKDMTIPKPKKKHLKGEAREKAAKRAYYLYHNTTNKTAQIARNMDISDGLVATLVGEHTKKLALDAVAETAEVAAHNKIIRDKLVKDHSYEITFIDTTVAMGQFKKLISEDSEDSEDKVCFVMDDSHLMAYFTIAEIKDVVSDMPASGLLQNLIKETRYEFILLNGKVYKGQFELYTQDNRVCFMVEDADDEYKYFPIVDIIGIKDIGFPSEHIAFSAHESPTRRASTKPEFQSTKPKQDPPVRWCAQDIRVLMHYFIFPEEMTDDSPTVKKCIVKLIQHGLLKRSDVHSYAVTERGRVFVNDGILNTPLPKKQWVMLDMDYSATEARMIHSLSGTQTLRTSSTKPNISTPSSEEE